MQTIDLYTDAWETTVSMAGVLDRDSSWRWDSDGKEAGQFVFWIVTGGTGVLWAGEDHLSLSSGSCLISWLGERHHGRQDAKDLLTIPWVVFEFRNSAGAIVHPQPFPPRLRKIGQVHFIEELILRAIGAVHGSDISNGEAMLWMRAVLCEVLRWDRRGRLSGPRAEKLNTIDDITDEIRRFPGRRYSLDDLAGRLYCSRDHCVRLFKEYTGKTPREYLIGARIEKASGLLKYSTYSVGEIADMLGYHSVFHFSSQYKQRTGTAPSETRSPIG